jgi:hypothetical protein
MVSLRVGNDSKLGTNHLFDKVNVSIITMSICNTYSNTLKSTDEKA